MGHLSMEVRTEVLCGRICDLEAENAKLRERIDAAHMSRLLTENENESLRELVRHMHECMSNVDADGNHECFVCEYENAECDFDTSMRELGIEATE